METVCVLLRNMSFGNKELQQGRPKVYLLFPPILPCSATINHEELCLPNNPLPPSKPTSTRRISQAHTQTSTSCERYLRRPHKCVDPTVCAHTHTASHKYTHT